MKIRKIKLDFWLEKEDTTLEEVEAFTQEIISLAKKRKFAVIDSDKATALSGILSPHMSLHCEGDINISKTVYAKDIVKVTKTKKSRKEEKE